MVYLFLANGCEEIEALTPVDMLRRAGIPVTTVGIGGKTVTGSHGITIEADQADADFTGDEMMGVILPGGMPGMTNLDASPVVEKALSMAQAEGGIIAAICASPSVLGHKGLLEGKKAVCYPGFEKELTGATVTDARVQKDGNVITAVGMGASLEFALALVEVFAGREKATALKIGVIGQ